MFRSNKAFQDRFYLNFFFFKCNVLLWKWASWSTVGSSEFLVQSNDTGKPKAILQQKISLWILRKKSLTQELTNPNILQKQLGRKRSSSVSVLGDRSCWSLWNFCKHSSVCLQNIIAIHLYGRKWCFSISYYSPKLLGTDMVPMCTAAPALVSLKDKIYTL